MLDILEGDLLVVNAVEYPIQAVGQWDMPFASSSFERMANVSASTKRSPGIISGKRGVPVTQLVNLYCMPLDPVDPQVRSRMAINTPHELLQTIIADGTGFCHLILEDLKR